MSIAIRASDTTHESEVGQHEANNIGLIAPNNGNGESVQTDLNASRKPNHSNTQ